MTSLRARRTLWGVIALLVFVGVLSGLSPFVSFAVLFAALWWRWRGVWGDGPAVGVASLATFAAVFITMCLAPGLPFPMPVEVSGLATLLVVAAVWSPPARSEDATKLTTWDWAAALSGGVVWLGGVLAGHLSPRGTGWSWATHIDSASYIFYLRSITEYGGIDTVSIRDSRPLETALTSVGIPVGHPLDSSPETVRVEIVTYAVGWVMLVFLFCTVAALVVHELTRVVGVPAALRRTLMAAVSIAMLLAPITGVVLHRGQVNAHVTWIAVLASVLVALRPITSPGKSSAVHVLAATLTLLSWTIFAPIPALLALASLIRWWRLGPHERRPDLPLVVAAVAFFAWVIVRFTGPDLLRAANPDDRFNQARSEYITRFPVPAWLPLTLGLLVFVGICAWALWRVSRTTGQVLALVAVGGLVCVLYIAFIGGLEMSPQTYYPARILQMLAVILFPIAVGGAFATFRSATVTATLIVAPTAMALTVMAMVAPITSPTPRWAFTPADFTTGRLYGSQEIVYDRILEYTSDNVAVLAWRLDQPYDFTVNHMLSILEPVPSRAMFSSQFRSEIRNYFGDYSAHRACAVAMASQRPLTLVTRDANLATEISLQCPEQTITVRSATD